ncbi:MAG: membrane integrity-associated transporter subunit PqiC [Candidatus Hydrogenedentes bacterium]|nr:membrane integrity-associated transporter subunit PqiC [Candidatus Hydrogenedentota bacterium]
MRYAAIALALAIAGCATRSYNPPTRYLLEPRVEAVRADSTGRTLAVRDLDPGRPYREKIVYRDGHQLGQYMTLEWAELPSDVVTRTLSDAIRATGRFVDVGPAPDVNQPDYTLTGSIRSFDLRKDMDPWMAVCEIRVEVRRSLSQNALYAQTLTSAVPLESNDTAALPAAMSAAVAEVVREAANGIAASEASAAE